MRVQKFFKYSSALLVSGLLSGCALGPEDYRPGPEGTTQAKADAYAHCRIRADALPAEEIALEDPLLGDQRDEFVTDCMHEVGYVRTRRFLLP
jgi:hypothetical protein